MVFGLGAAKVVVLPVVLALCLSFLLSPLVHALGRIRIPAGLGAAIVVGVLVASTGYAAYTLAYPAADWAERIPDLVRDVERTLRELNLDKPIESVSQASREVEELTSGAGNDTPKVEVAGDSVTSAALVEMRDLVVTLGVAVVLLYFFLASETAFLRKLVRMQPALSSKKHAVATFHRIQQDVAAYLFTISVINAGLGAAVALSMHILEMPNPVLWGAMAAILNFIPYLGALAGVFVISLVSIATFHDLGAILAAPTAYFTCTAIEGYFVTPLIVGARLRLSPVVIIVAFMFWGWLWGIAGALLAVPLLAIFKILCDSVESLHPVGELIEP